MKILADASLPGLVEAFPPPFEMTYYHHGEEVAGLLSGQEILLCRSTLKVNEQLLANSSLSFVATASSGTDHIDIKALGKHQITLIDAKGSNADSVADYVLATLAYLQCHQGFIGKKAGIIGMGAVGNRVAHYLKGIHFEVVTYDPPKAVLDSNFVSCSMEELLQCDVLCIHANLHDTSPFPSRNLITDSELSKLKSHAVIINAARGGIVSEEALLRLNHPAFYCSDVFLNEPQIDKRIVEFSTLCTPHIAGHSLEAKTTAVTDLSKKLHAYYELVAPTFPEDYEPVNLTFHPSWQETILSIYNPFYETIELKNGQDFQLLRKQHCTRHNFNTCSILKNHPDLQFIFDR